MKRRNIFKILPLVAISSALGGIIPYYSVGDRAKQYAITQAQKTPIDDLCYSEYTEKHFKDYIYMLENDIDTDIINKFYNSSENRIVSQSWRDRLCISALVSYLGSIREKVLCIDIIRENGNIGGSPCNIDWNYGLGWNTKRSEKVIENHKNNYVLIMEHRERPKSPYDHLASKISLEDMAGKIKTFIL